MIISDLQYIETVENSEVQGASGYKHKHYKFHKPYKPYKPSYKFTGKAEAGATSIALGDKTATEAFTETKVVPGGSSSSAYSKAEAKTY